MRCAELCAVLCAVCTPEAKAKRKAFDRTPEAKVKRKARDAKRGK